MLMIVISIVLMMVMVGCDKEESSTVVPLQAASDNGEQQGATTLEVVSESEPNGEAGESIDAEEISKPLGHHSQSLEQISAKDGEKYLEALKQQDLKGLSRLMAHAENEYTVADMKKVVEGFLLYFDGLEELQLEFEANEQNDEYYVEHYIIAGTKDGKARAIPFEIKYAKSQGMERIQKDEEREPLYNSPLIGQYPYASMEAERYVQALMQKDTASLALHLGMYDDN